MPIPLYTDTLRKKPSTQSALGPGITIIQGGNIFGSDYEKDEPISFEQVTSELRDSKDPLEIIPMVEREDHLLAQFQRSRES